MPDAGRVVTGAAGGLRLVAPGPGTRPLSDKVKQALFSMLEAERADVWERALLDLFAGSGAAGIEALSRGAPLAVFVERAPRAIEVIRKNLERTGLSERAHVVRADVTAFLARPRASDAAGRFGSVVIDPPYEQASDLLRSLGALSEPASSWLDDEAVIITKHFWKDDPPRRVGSLERTRQRRFGETALSVYRRV